MSGSAQLRAGQSVLVLGASGVVGQLAIQAARILGAGQVVAAARSAEGRTTAQRLGANASVAVDNDLPTALSAVTPPGGFDVVLDTLWGPPAVAALGALAPWGVLVQVGSSAGEKIELPSAMLRMRNASVTGYSSALLSPAEFASGYLDLVTHAIAGRLTLELDRVPLADVPRAWADQAAGPRRKLVVLPAE